MSASTLEVSSTVRPVCSSISLADQLHRRPRRAPRRWSPSTGSSRCSSPTAHRTRAGSGTAPACGASRPAPRGSDEVLVAALDHLARSPSFFSPRREVGREEEHLQLAVLRQRVGELAELLVDLVELVVLLRDLEQRPRVDLGDLFHLLVPAPAARRRRAAEKSTSDSASWISRRWSSPSSDLRVTFSVASTVRSATSLRISSSARRVSCSMSRRVAPSAPRAAAWPPRATRPGALRRLARAGDDVLGLLARLAAAAARYSSSSSSASCARALGGVDRLLDRLRALVERLADARERELRRARTA